MPRTVRSITLAEARRMLAAAEAKAAGLSIAYNIAVVDASAHLVAFLRQDGGLIAGIELAVNKAVTARIVEKSTADLASLAQPGMPLFGIQEGMRSSVVIFGGGLPIMCGGDIIGGVGASAGTVEQDIAVARAALAALDA